MLTVTVGLAERFLEERLRDTLGDGEGTVLEMKDERGLGKTIDVILNRGELNVGDTITLVGSDGPFSTHIKGMFRPKGMSEMRDAGDRWEACDTAVAACGLKIVAPNLENVLAGTTLRQTNTAEAKSSAEKDAYKEAKISVDIAEEGVVIKADTVGGLEALAFELDKMEIPIRMATVGPVNKRDIITAQCADDALNQVILGFSVKGNTEVQPKLEGPMRKLSSSVRILSIAFSKNSKSGETIPKQKWMLLREKIWFILATYCTSKTTPSGTKAPLLLG